jgi:hypothetical protein
MVVPRDTHAAFEREVPGILAWFREHPPGHAARGAEACHPFASPTDWLPMHRSLAFVLALLGLIVASTAEGAARSAGDGAEGAWSEDRPAVRRALTRGAPLVVHVLVALCHNGQIACGSGGLGNPVNLRTNLYWGALFGAKRFFDRKDSGYQALGKQAAPEAVLERVAYRRFVDGAAWGLERRVEQIVVLDAIDGNRIDDAVGRLFRIASSGARMTLDDGGKRRRVAVHVVGYAGHNRFMDGLAVPDLEARAAVPSFVFACLSERYFARPLARAGSRALVTTRAFIAPEGYALTAATRAIGDNASPEGIRQRVVEAYARWQRIPERTAARYFSVPRAE